MPSTLMAVGVPSTGVPSWLSSDDERRQSPQPGTGVVSQRDPHVLLDRLQRLQPSEQGLRGVSFCPRVSSEWWWGPEKDFKRGYSQGPGRIPGTE